MLANILLGALMGAIISIGGLLPGISGGALCVILGVYQPMMQLFGDILPLCGNFFGWLTGKIARKANAPKLDARFGQYIKFFWPIGVGVLVGALGIAKLLGVFLEKNETAALFLFIGLIVGTLPSLLREAREQGAGASSYAALVLALVLMLAWMIPMSMAGQAQVAPSLGWWCICGVLWGLGIIVPGMSPSNIFFFLGLATPMYAAIGGLNLAVLLPMVACLAATIIVLSKGVQLCLKRWYAPFMHAVVGVVLASTVVILPPVKVLIQPGYTYATGAADWAVYAVCFALGLLSAWGLGKIEKK